MFKHIKGYGGLMLLAMIISLLSAGVKVQGPVVIKYAVDVLISGDGVASEYVFLSRCVPDLLSACLVLIGIRVLEALLRYLSGVLKNSVIERVGERLRNKLYRRIQFFSFETHGKMQTGELIQRSTADTENYLDFFRSQIDEIGRLSFIMIASLWIMLSMNITLTSVSLVMAPIVVVISLRFHMKITAIREDYEKKEAYATGVAQESISGVRVVKAFGRERFETDRYERASEEMMDSYSVWGIKLSRYFAVTDFISIAQISATLILGSYLVISGSLTVGTLLAFLMYAEWLTWPLKQLARMIVRIGKATVSVRRLNEILDMPVDEDDGWESPEIDGEIVFDKVCFSYGDHPVLRDISFRLSPGETLGILGHTGSGKSTLAMLLPRLMEYEGSIKIDGVELRTIRKSVIREQIGLILQEPYLFSKTVRENIDTKKNRSESEIRRAASLADIHRSIERFSDGYETLVGERGAQLSGGQKQRISISRTIIEPKKVLIFDDSLSAVDAETDRTIRSSLEQYRSGITRILVSHRISTVMNADKIIVLKDGRISEAGTHETLRGAGGLYQKLWEIQTMED